MKPELLKKLNEALTEGPSMSNVPPVAPKPAPPSMSNVPVSRRTPKAEVKVVKGLRPFAKHDWYGLAGAEAPEGGSPLIANPDIKGMAGVELVVDANGLGVIGVDAENESRTIEFHMANQPFGDSKDKAEQLLTTPDLSMEKLTAMGFEQISG